MNGLVAALLYLGMASANRTVFRPPLNFFFFGDSVSEPAVADCGWHGQPQAYLDGSGDALDRSAAWMRFANVSAGLLRLGNK